MQRNKVVTLRLSDDEKKAITECAKDTGLTTASWMRLTLMKECKKQKKGDQ